MADIADVLSRYEAKIHADEMRDERSFCRARMLREQAQGRWLDFLGSLRGCVVDLNRLAGRSVLREETCEGAGLILRRENDGVELAVKFCREMNRVNVSLGGMPEEKRLELTIHERGGIDSTVWKDCAGGVCKSDKDLAGAILQDFLLVSI